MSRADKALNDDTLIETALIAKVLVGRPNTHLRDKYMEIHSIIHRKGGIDTHITRSHPGDYVHVSTRFTAHTKVDDELLKIDFDEESETIISIGETTRRGSSNLHFTGQHIKNARFAYDALGMDHRAQALLGSDFDEFNMVPVVVTGVPDIDMFIHTVKIRLCRYSCRQETHARIRACLCDLIEAMRTWLDAAKKRETFLDGSEWLGYKVVRDASNQSLFDAVCDKMGELRDEFETLLSHYCLPASISECAEASRDLKALNEYVNGLRAAPFWRTTAKRLERSDCEADNPEGVPMSMSEVISDMRNNNEAQITSVESTCRFFGGLSLPVLVAVFALIRNYAFRDELFWLVFFAVVAHFIATIFSFWLLWFSSRRMRREPPMMSSESIMSESRAKLLAKRKEEKSAYDHDRKHLMDYKVQLEYCGNEDLFYWLMYESVNNTGRVAHSIPLMSALRSLTKSAYDLKWIVRLNIPLVWSYIVTVALYAVAAFVFYWLQWGR